MPRIYLEWWRSERKPIREGPSEKNSESTATASEAAENPTPICVLLLFAVPHHRVVKMPCQIMYSTVRRESFPCHASADFVVVQGHVSPKKRWWNRTATQAFHLLQRL